MGRKSQKTKAERVDEFIHYGTHKEDVVLEMGKLAVAKDQKGKMYLTHEMWIGNGLLDPYKDKHRRRKDISEDMLETLKTMTVTQKDVEELYELIKPIEEKKSE